jgi:hypothetical protein
MTAQGHSVRSIDDCVRTGRLHRLRPGRYVDGQVWRGLSRIARHALLVADLVPAGAGGAVVSHLSAAVLHALAIPGGADLSRAHLTWPGSAGRAPTCNLSPHRAFIDPADIIDLGGIAVTSVARTLYDLARSEDQLLSVPVADAALGENRCDRADIAATLDRAAGRPGSSLAAQVLAFANPLATIFAQSRARVLMARAGLPVPGLAVTIDHPWGWQMGPFDFDFAAEKTVAMVIDQARPVHLLRTGVEESLRQAGLAIAWIESGDLAGPAHLERRMRRAFALSGRRDHRRRSPRMLPGRVDSISAASISPLRYPG